MSEEQGDVVAYGQPVGYGQAVGVGLAYEPPPNNDFGNGGTAAAAGHSASASDESQLLLATQTSVQHEPPQASPAGTAGTKSAGGGGEGAVAADAASRSSVGLGHRSCVTVCVREAPLGALFATLLLSFGATAAGVGLYFGLTDLRASLGLRHDWLMVGEWVGVGLAGALLAFGLLQYLFITLSNASTYDRLFRVPKHTHLVLPYCLNYFFLFADAIAFVFWLVLFGLLAVVAAFNAVPHILFPIYGVKQVDLRHYGIFEYQLAPRSQPPATATAPPAGSTQGAAAATGAGATGPTTAAATDNRLLLTDDAYQHFLTRYLQTIFVSMRAPRLDPEVNALDEELDAVVYADTAGHAGAQEAAVGTMDCSAHAEHVNAPPSQRASAALT